MPTYDYQCAKCGHEFEAFQRMLDDPLKDCPECNAPELRRLISGGTGVIFKGSGFYVNDSRKGSSKSGGKAATSESGSDAGTTGTGSDATTANTDSSSGDSGTSESKTTETKSGESGKGTTGKSPEKRSA